jgi:hypothetical protein
MAITSKLKLRKREGLTNTLRNSTWDKGKGRDSGKRKDKDKSKGKDRGRGRGRGRDKSRDSDKGIELIALMTSVTRSEALSRRSSS